MLKKILGICKLCLTINGKLPLKELNYKSCPKNRGMQRNDDISAAAGNPGENRPQHPEQELQVANYSRGQALQYLQNGNPGRALAHFNVALSLIPEWRADLKHHFLRSLSGGCRQLEEVNRFDTAIELKKEALKLYPENEEILCDIGSHYLLSGDSSLALSYYQQSLSNCPDFLPAIRGTHAVKNLLVERWHFRMLNDRNRNSSFRAAITKKIQEGSHSVLDIGTGSGLLSLYAVSAGAENVWACEVQKHMFDVASSVISANNASDKINLINKLSTQIVVPSDMEKRVSLVVTETFDAGLFGEGILDTLQHAWDKLLLPVHNPDIECDSSGNKSETNGLVVPYGATVWIAAVQSIDIAMRYRLLPNNCLCFSQTLDKSSTGNLVRHGDYNMCKFCYARAYGSDRQKHNMDFFFEDAKLACSTKGPYDSEDLRFIPHGYQLLTKPHKALEINFNDRDSLNKHFCNMGEVHKLEVEKAGSVDAIAVWFHLNLDNNGTIISTAPFEEVNALQTSCWHQAIFPYFHLHSVQRGDSLAQVLKTAEGKLEITPARDWPNTSHLPYILVSDHVISFLNNRTWVDRLLETASDITRIFSEATHPARSKRVLDFNPFPVLGLKMLKENESTWQLVAFAASESDQQYIQFVARRNGILDERIKFVSGDQLTEALDGPTFDVINLNVTCVTGELDEKMIYLIPDLRMRLSPNGIMVPHTVAVECQIIASEWLLQNSHVINDSSVDDFDIARFMNDFMVSHHIDVKAHGVPYHPMSLSQEVARLCVNQTGAGSLCSEQQKEFLVAAVGSGNASGILYWMNIVLRPHLAPVSTFCVDSHCNQAAFLSQSPVIEGDKVKLLCLYHHGLLKLKLSSEV